MKVVEHMKIKVIAFYLPQYHEIPENSAWWGNGFTEWTNMRHATSLFAGHDQPRIPLHNNYYDLTNASVLSRFAQNVTELRAKRN